MRENCTSGSARGAPGNRRPYRGDAERSIRNGGILIRRDSLASVRYAEELNSSTISAIHQGTDRHGIVGQTYSDFQLDSCKWSAVQDSMSSNTSASNHTPL